MQKIFQLSFSNNTAPVLPVISRTQGLRLRFTKVKRRSIQPIPIVYNSQNQKIIFEMFRFDFGATVAKIFNKLKKTPPYKDFGNPESVLSA